MATKRWYGADHSEVVDVVTARTWVLRVNQHYLQDRGRTTHAGLQCDRTRAYLHKLHRYLVARSHDKAVVFADLDPFALLEQVQRCHVGAHRVGGPVDDDPEHLVPVAGGRRQLGDLVEERELLDLAIHVAHGNDVMSR